MESKYRCTTCQLIFDEPKIIYEITSKGRKEAFDVCPRCSAFVFKEQEKVTGSETQIITMVPENRTKLNPVTFDSFLSRFSNTDLLLAIHLTAEKYKAQKGELARLDDQLWKSVSAKKNMRQF